MSKHRPWISAATVALAALALFQSAKLHAAQTDFASAVTSTKPIAYFRLDATSGKGEVGSSSYKSAGGVTVGSPGATIAGSSNNFAKFDGASGYILTTQKGGVGTSASVMAWVNLEALPSKIGHFFYVAGESENGNDLDLQFETDNVLRFFTAGGGRLEY